jgi:hypothetical protein
VTNPERDHIHPQSWDRDEAQHLGENTHGSNFRFDFGGQTLLTILVFSVLIGITGVMIGLDISERAQMSREFDKLSESYKALTKQNWLLERRLMDKEALDIIHGDKLPSDTEFGATGNLQRMKPHKP